MITFWHELYPSTDILERMRMVQILRLQAITKFCHYAENVAAIAIAFKSTYSVGEIVDK